jgi:hypothetical protein
VKEFFLIIKEWNENKPIGITYIARKNKFNKHIHVYINQYQYVSQIISIL